MTNIFTSKRLHIKSKIGWYIGYGIILSLVIIGFIFFPLTIIAGIIFLLDRIRKWRVNGKDAYAPKFPWRNKVVMKMLEMRDGVVLAVDTINLSGKRGEKVLFLAHGVGGDSLSYELVIEHFLAKDWAVVCWDFRGLFRSSSTSLSSLPNGFSHIDNNNNNNNNNNSNDNNIIINGGSNGNQHHDSLLLKMSMRDNADDALQILQQLGIDKVEAFMGWSTGVQIILEFAAHNPGKVNHLILCNGTYGQAFNTGWPFRLPFLHSIAHLSMNIVGAMVDGGYFPYFLKFYKFMRPLMYVNYYVYAFLFGTPKLVFHLNYYMENVFGNGATHFRNYCQYFQELDAHSIYHLLRSIRTPTLICSGAFDVLTPAYNMFEMSSLLSDCDHCHFLNATHFVPLEVPQELCDEIEMFLASRSGKQRNSIAHSSCHN